MTATDPTTDDRYRTVEIPARTARTISKRLRGTEFDSVDEYVSFALDQLLRELERPADRDPDGDGESATGRTDHGAAEDEHEGATDEAVADRLESLGYL